MEVKNMARFQEVMKSMQQTASGNLQYNSQPQNPNYVPIPIPFPQSQSAPSKPDVVEELMKKMFMRKVMAKFFDQKDDQEDEDDQDDFFGVDDDEKFAEMLFFSKNKRNRFVSFNLSFHSLPSCPPGIKFRQASSSALKKWFDIVKRWEMGSIWGQQIEFFRWSLDNLNKNS